MDLKTCKQCEQQLPETSFYMKSKSTGRLDSFCKECRYAKNMEYRKNNREKIREQSNLWYAKNSEKVEEQRKKKLSSMTEEEIARNKIRQDINRKNYADRNREAYLKEHGQPPLCECGCGQKVNFDSKGRPNTFVKNHQPINIEGIGTKIREPIPVEKFRTAVQKLRKERGWTVKELAERGGVGYSHLSSILYSKNRNSPLEKKWVELFLRRVAGLSAPPSTYQLKEYERIKDHEKRLSI